MTHYRPVFWHFSLTAALWLAGSGLVGQSCALGADAAGAKKHSDYPLLESRGTDKSLLEFGAADALKHLNAPKNFKVSRRGDSVEVTGSIEGKGQSLVISSQTPPWDLSRYQYVAVDVRNTGGSRLTIVCRAEDPDYAGWQHYAEAAARVNAGETASVLVLLKRCGPQPEPLRALFPGMGTLPDGFMSHWSGLDPARISRIIFALESSQPQMKLELLRVRGVGVGDSAALPAPDFFPFIDAYGQFKHGDWSTKIHSAADFQAQRAAEAAALQANPRPTTWDQYGGFKTGPQLKASGNFRVEKYQGKWWFVDPDGRLFWSHGVTGIGFGSSTPVKGREKFFAEIPESDRGKSKAADFYLSNITLKYGKDPQNALAELDQQRLANWGLNTVAVWSDPKVTSLDKTPYTKILSIGASKIAPGLRMADPYDDGFARSARAAFEAEKDSSGKDPWCIGYFIANEVEWRNGPDIVNEILAASAKQPAKRELVKLLQERHPTIAELNTAWHTSYTSFDNVLDSTAKVDAKLAVNDFTAFNEQLAQRYYETVQTEMKEVLPSRLNLGSRFNTGNMIAIRAAAKYCDVVSFNKYATTLRNLALPDGVDRPIIVGEFHFPAWDRSFTASADCGRLCEVRRADSYWYYLTTAIENPLVVGTHWFQFLDQPLTARGDGENVPIGFVDVTDTPYDELTKVTREMGDTLYTHRLDAK